MTIYCIILFSWNVQKRHRKHINGCLEVMVGIRWWKCSKTRLVVMTVEICKYINVVVFYTTWMNFMACKLYLSKAVKGNHCVLLDFPSNSYAEQAQMAWLWWPRRCAIQCLNYRNSLSSLLRYLYIFILYISNSLYSAHEPELAYDNMGQAMLFLYLNPWNRGLN